MPSRWTGYFKRTLTTTKAQGKIQGDINDSLAASASNALLEQTRQLLDPSNKLDATDPQLWDQADQLLMGWLMDEVDYDNVGMDVHPLKRVECCLRLLDRLAASLPQGEIMFASLLETKLLHRLLKLWKHGMQMSADDDNASIQRLRRLLTPSVFAQKMDKYRWVSLIQPDVYSFNLLLHAASSPMLSYREGVMFADALLRRLIQVSLEQLHQNDDAPPLMDVISISTVMQAWVEHRKPEQAEAWLHELESWRKSQSNAYLCGLRPNNIMYTTVLSGWAKVGNAERALDILERQMDDFQHGNDEAQPDVATFNCVLDALAKSKDQSAWKKAETILAQMKEYATVLGWNCAPDIHTWTILLACYGRHKPRRAERLLKELEAERQPVSLVAYNTMLNGYAQAGKFLAALELLEKLEASPDLAPDETSYNTVLSSYVASKEDDAPAQGEALLSRMRQQGVAPTTVSYSTLMQCWAKSKDPRAAERVEELLEEMKQYPESQPNIICYNIVLNAWGNQARLASKRTNDQKALERVLRLFQEMVERSNTNPKHDALRPTDVTIRTVLHAIAACSASRKGELIDSLTPVMKKYGFRPNAKDEKLLRRLAKSRTQKEIM